MQTLLLSSDRKSGICLAEKCSSMSFIEVDILKSNGTMAIGVLSDLDLHYQDQTFSCYAFATKKCACSGCPRQICLDSHRPAVMLLLLFQFCCFFNSEKPNYYVLTPARTWKVRQRGGPYEIIGSIYSVWTADTDRCCLRLLLLHVCGT